MSKGKAGICQICGKEVKSLGQHIKAHKIKPKEYYDKYLKQEGEGICNNLDCQNETTFQTFNKGYLRYCSSKCASRNEETKKKREKTCTKKYGETHVSKVSCIKEKIKETCIEKYGVENPMQNEKVIEKAQNTCLEKYGVKSIQQTEEMRKLTSEQSKEYWKNDDYRKQVKVGNKKAWDNKTEEEMQEFKQKIINTKMKRHGEPYYTNKYQRKETFKKRYGGLHYNNLEQRRKTLKERYGDENYVNVEKIRETNEKSGKWLSLDMYSEYELYRYLVWKESEKTYKKYFKQLTKNGKLKRAKYEYHLDHRFSILEGFKQGIEPDIMGRLDNLQMLWWKDNIIKSSKCDIELEKLLGEVIR